MSGNKAKPLGQAGAGSRKLASRCYERRHGVCRAKPNSGTPKSTPTQSLLGAGVGAAFTRATQSLGIDNLHFHDLRHEATSRLFERGYSIQEVAQLAMHESWTTLKRTPTSSQKTSRNDSR